MKIQVTKLGIKLDGKLLGKRYFEQTKEKVAKIIDGRPERIRTKWQTNTTSDFYIDIEVLRNICKDVLNIDITQEYFNKKINNTCPQCYTNGQSIKWTAKAISGFLNEIFKTNTFRW